MLAGSRQTPKLGPSVDQLAHEGIWQMKVEVCRNARFRHSLWKSRLRSAIHAWLSQRSSRANHVQPPRTLGPMPVHYLQHFQGSVEARLWRRLSCFHRTALYLQCIKTVAGFLSGFACN